MAKLYFRYGTVGSAKTLNLLAVAHNYRQQKKNVLIAVPEVDERFGVGVVRSRSGLEEKADLVVGFNGVIDEGRIADVHCILVDEAQFMSERFIDQLRYIASFLNIPVICYGLRTDFRSQFFEGSRRLMELADSIEEIKTTCNFCMRKAVFNLKVRDGLATREGPSIELGVEDRYLPTCSRCYHEKLVRV